MFQWTTYTDKPETVPPVHRVPIGESQYVRSVTRRRRRSGGLAGFPALSMSRNFVPLPPQPYVDPSGEGIYPGPRIPPTAAVNYAGVITGDKRGVGDTALLGPPVYADDPRQGCPKGYHLDYSNTGQGYHLDYSNTGPDTMIQTCVPNRKGWNPHPMPVDVVGPPLPVTPDPPAPTTPATDSTSGSLTSLLSGIPTTYLLIGAVGLYFFMKKK